MNIKRPHSVFSNQLKDDGDNDENSIVDIDQHNRLVCEFFDPDDEVNNKPVLIVREGSDNEYDSIVPFSRENCYELITQKQRTKLSDFETPKLNFYEHVIDNSYLPTEYSSSKISKGSKLWWGRKCTDDYFLAEDVQMCLENERMLRSISAPSVMFADAQKDAFPTQNTDNNAFRSRVYVKNNEDGSFANWEDVSGADDKYIVPSQHVVNVRMSERSADVNPYTYPYKYISKSTPGADYSESFDSSLQPASFNPDIFTRPDDVMVQDEEMVVLVSTSSFQGRRGWKRVSVTPEQQLAVLLGAGYSEEAKVRLMEEFQQQMPFLEKLNEQSNYVTHLNSVIATTIVVVAVTVLLLVVMCVVLCNVIINRQKMKRMCAREGVVYNATWFERFTDSVIVGITFFISKLFPHQLGDAILTQLMVLEETVPMPIEIPVKESVPVLTESAIESKTQDSYPILLENGVLKISAALKMFTENIIGYGSHGTVVFRGIFHDRFPVAVKRMLGHYEHVALREVNTLIELSSDDGHPNIVKYYYASLSNNRDSASGSNGNDFSGNEFVYVALQLCDMSLKDFVSKVRSYHKNLQSSTESGQSKVLRITPVVKEAMRQMASGVDHLHSKKRIIHRDLKPGNILLLSHGKVEKHTDDAGLSEHVDKNKPHKRKLKSKTHAKHPKREITLSEINQIREFTLKISDMGLSKQISADDASDASNLALDVSSVLFGKKIQSQTFGSYTITDKLDSGKVDGVRGDFTVVGTVGWQAPELLVSKYKSHTSPRHSNNIANEDDKKGSSSVQFDLLASADVFSLGCVFYYFVTLGDHPFGEGYEREVNIMRGHHCLLPTEFITEKSMSNQLNTAQDIRQLHPDLFDLILRMISPVNPVFRGSSLSDTGLVRPSIDQVLKHPFFWNLSQRADFLIEFSDLIEHIVSPTGKTSSGAKASGARESTFISDDAAMLDLLFALEGSAADIVSTDWSREVFGFLLDDCSKFRKYDTTSVRDCLRLLRNKKHHFHEIKPESKLAIANFLSSGTGVASDNLATNSLQVVEYFEAIFPKLFFHCVKVSCNHVPQTERLYTLFLSPIATLFMNKKNSELATKKLDTIAEVSEGSEISQVVVREESNVTKPIYWAGSVLCNTITESSPSPCRGWFRSSSVWVVSDSGGTCANKGRKSPSSVVANASSHLRKAVQDTLNTYGISTVADVNYRNLMKNAYYCTYRSKLCMHWITSSGTNCPMKKKGKCDFAHGLVELRNTIRDIGSASMVAYYSRSKPKEPSTPSDSEASSTSNAYSYAAASFVSGGSPHFHGYYYDPNVPSYSMSGPMYYYSSPPPPNNQDGK